MSDEHPPYRRAKLVDCPRCGSGVRPGFPALAEDGTPRWECADMECRHEFEAEGEASPICGTVMPED